jgi:hypothetical protein
MIYAALSLVVFSNPLLPGFFSQPGKHLLFPLYVLARQIRINRPDASYFEFDQSLLLAFYCDLFSLFGLVKMFFPIADNLC